MREDLLKQISSMKEITHIVVLTHNIDFVFVQTVLLSALRKCGHPSLTIFADALCAEQSYLYQSKAISGLGKRYRVIPVAMSPGYRFHPKGIFLVGPEEAALFVGSGNMTFGGMRDNAEIWCRYDTENGEFAAISSFKNYLEATLGRVVLSEAVELDLIELFNEQNNGWANELAVGPGDLLGRVDSSEPLLSQIEKIVRGNNNGPVTRLVICTPYFDPQGKALEAFYNQMGKPDTEVLVQSRRSTLFSHVATKLPKNILIKSINFKSQPGHDEVSSRRFIHAKFFAVEQGNSTLVFAGSANCSRAAILSDGSYGNAELISYKEISSSEFNSEFLSEFEIREELPEFLSEQEIEQEDEVLPQLRLLGARYEINIIKVGFRAPEGITISSCQVDDIEIPFRLSNKSEVSIRFVGSPNKIQMFGNINGVETGSNIIWVDDESKLRATSHGRELIEKVYKSENAGEFDSDQWALFVKLFAKDLEYKTAKEIRDQNKANKSAGDTEGVVVSHADVFSDSYEQASVFPGHKINELGEKGFSISQLILNAYGIKKSDKQGSNLPNDPGNDVEVNRPSDALPSNSENDADKEEPVDTPEDFSKVIVKKKPTKKKRKNINKKRMLKVAESIAVSLADPEFLEIRDPLRLGTDLQIAGLLLRKGLSKGWLSDMEFFDITQKIWSALFFSSQVNSGVGWLELRYRRAKDKKQFTEAISSSGLAATLLAWATAVSLKGRGVYFSRFLLSQYLGMGRLPWIWKSVDEGEASAHLLRILIDSPCGDFKDLELQELHKVAQAQRIEWLKFGLAIVSMEHKLHQIGLSALRSNLQDKSVDPGDLLWQGKRGLCIALDSSRECHDTVKVICLQDPEGKTEFRKDYLIPIKALVGQSVNLGSEIISEIHRIEIKKLLDRIKTISSEPWIF
jgi:hypothetical protein